MNPLSPVIIPRSQHVISRSSLSPNALRVLYRLKDHGYIAYLVGGCVRDLWLGREPKDFDVVTNATPGQIKRIFRNCRLIGRRFRLAHLHFSDEILEVATFRAPDGGEEAGTEGDHAPRHLKDDEGMLLRDNVFGTPEEDARRRDFTVNALCYNVADFSIIDYCGGIADLENGIIRTIGDPMVRFTEDPVRMLRAVRFAALLGFNIEKETWEALLKLSPTICRSSPPRLYEEVLKLLLCGEGERCYQLMRQTGLFAGLFPHFHAWLDTESGGFPHTRVSTVLEKLDAFPPEEKPSPQLMLALVFGQYLEEKAEKYRQGRVPANPAMDMAVADFLTELAPTVLIPHKMAMLMREILIGQYRLRKIPGRQPHLFVTRPGFPATLAYLRLLADLTGEQGQVLAWWDRFVRELPEKQETGAGATEPAEPAAGGEKKRRRRRRRRRPAGGGEGGTPS